MPILIVEKGPERGQNVELQAGCRWIFGRDVSCDFSTKDVSCSRKHFGIAEKNGRFIVKDLNSTHGTTVNGNIVEMKELSDGDTIVAGETVFSFAVDSSVSSGRGLVGKTIAGYQIFERIGRGGMGTVFRAKQVALDRDVALKVLSARYSNDKTFINRFFKEAQAAARLNNPNVVQVFDVREEKGLYLISLEMMDGGTVQELATKEGQLPIERVLKIAREATKGLTYAEKKSIVHGDIKPDNLMMNADGHIKISDLGLARDVGEIAHQGEEGVFGTPHFISPEQAQGKAVDSRSDIYSLGATLYRLVAGTTPFSGASVREIIMKQINEEPPPLAEKRDDCPADFADLISVMMAKDPDDRFESASALQQAVESLGETGSLANQGSSAKKIAIAVGVLVLVAITAFMLQEKDKPQPINPTPQSNTGTKQLTPEEIAQQAEQARERLELEVRGRRATAELFLAELRLDGKAEDIASLNALIVKYEEAKAAGPDTKEAEIVDGKIAGLRIKIKKLKEANATALAASIAKKKAAEVALAGLNKTVNDCLTKKHFDQALASLAQGSEALKDSHLKDELPKLKSLVLDAVEAASKKMEENVTSQLQNDKFEEARQTVTTFRSSMVSGSAESPPTEFKKYLARITAQEQSILGRETEKKDADRKLDQSTVYSALQSYYSKFAKNYSLDAKRNALSAMRSALQTDHFRPRMKRISAALDKSIAFRDAIIAQVNDSPGSVSTSRGSREIPAGKIVKATHSEITIKKRSGKEESVSWKDLGCDVLYAAIFKRFDSTVEVRLGLIAWLIECMEFETAMEVMSDVAAKLDGESQEVKSEFAALEKVLKEEIEARDVLAEVKELRRKAATSTTVGHWIRIRNKLEQFVQRYRGTRTYLIHSDGSSALK